MSIEEDKVAGDSAENTSGIEDKITLNKLVATPNEIVLKLLNALAFSKGKISLAKLMDFISKSLEIGIDYLKANKKYTSFIIGSLISHKDIILFLESKQVDDKAGFFYSLDIDSLVDGELSKEHKTQELHLSKEKLWEYLTGEKENGESILGAKTFDLLLEIAYHKEKGIDRVALCKNCNQDLRSMPSRLKALEKYTVTVNTMTKGRITQCLWHKKFASSGASKTDALNARASEKILIIEKLKEAPDGIREISDLKEELEITGDRRKGKRFRLNYFWLDAHQYLKRILVKSENNGKIYFCLKYMKDYSIEDDGGSDDDDQYEDEYLNTAANDEVESNNFPPISHKSVGNFECLTLAKDFNSTGLLDSSVPMVNKVFSNEFILKSLVENSGKEGLRSMDICNNLFSSEFIRPFNKFMTSHIKQPNELSTELEKNSTQLVKAYDFEGKTKHFRVFTNESYQQKYGSNDIKFIPFHFENIKSSKLDQKTIAKEYEMSQNFYWLDYIQLENGDEEYLWVNTLPPVLKKQLLVLRNNANGKTIKKQKISKINSKPTKIEVFTDDIEISDNSKTVQQTESTTKKIDVAVATPSAGANKTSRLTNLTTVTSLLGRTSYNRMEKKKFGDLLGHSIRSVKTQQALLSLIGEHNGLFCYFDKYIIKDVRHKMNVSYDIDKKVLKRDILNLMEVKKIKSFKFGNQIYLTFPVVTKEQVKYFHENKLENLKKKVGFEKNVSLKEKFLEKITDNALLSEADLTNSVSFMNNEFITSTTECIVRKELFFQMPNKKKDFESKPVVKVKADSSKTETKKKIVKKKKQLKVKKVKKHVSARSKRISKRSDIGSLAEFGSTPKEIIPVPVAEQNEHPLLSFLQDDYVQYNDGAEPKPPLQQDLLKKSILTIERGQRHKETPTPPQIGETENQNENGVSSSKIKKIKKDVVSKAQIKEDKRIIKADMRNFIRICVLSSCIEKDINWSEISHLFSKSKPNLQKTFEAEIEKNGGDEWLEDKQDYCRDFLLSNLKVGSLDMEDIENLRYLKIIEVWFQYEKLVAEKPINLLSDVNEFRKKFKLSTEAVDSCFENSKNALFSEKSYFRTSLVKRYKGLLRKEYYYPVTNRNKNDKQYSAIKCALKSVLLDQVGSNNKHSKVNINVIASYIKQYDSTEINNVIKEFSKKKLVIFNNNTLQLNDFFVDSFLKLNQSEFFQKYKQNKTLADDSLLNGKFLALDNEINAPMTGYLIEKMNESVLTAATLNGKGNPSLENDTKYHIKDESILDTALILFSDTKRKTTTVDNNFIFSPAPGLGVPYSRMWIDGNGDVRSEIWKVCLSYLCFQLYLKPELNTDSLYFYFKTCLDSLEIQELVNWLRENKILKENDAGEYEFIDFDVACLLF